MLTGAFAIGSVVKCRCQDYGAHIHVHIYVYTYIYVFIYIYVYIYIYTYTYTYRLLVAARRARKKAALGHGMQRWRNGARHAYAAGICQVCVSLPSFFTTEILYYN